MVEWGSWFSKSWEWLNCVFFFSKAKRKDEISTGNKCPLFLLHNVFHTLHASASTIYVTATVLGFGFCVLHLNEKDESIFPFVFCLHWSTLCQRYTVHLKFIRIGSNK